MTSVLRRYDQIGQRIRYFITLYDVSTNPTGFLAGTDVYAFIVPQGTFGPVAQVQDTQISSITGAAPVSMHTGQLWRDLGRSIYVYAANPNFSSSQVAIFRQVMPSNGQYTEGIPSLGPTPVSYYVKTWSSSQLMPSPDYAGVAVARTG